jgi:hypothetical protein
MEKRDEGMDEVEKRCRPLYNSIPLKKVIRLPDRVINERDMPCVLIMEGDDYMNNPSNRNPLGYPCRRILNVIIESWDLSSGDVRNINEEVRKAVLANKGQLVSEVIIRESKTVGPFNFEIPNVLGFRTVFEMNYTDSGPDF